MAETRIHSLYDSANIGFGGEWSIRGQKEKRKLIIDVVSLCFHSAWSPTVHSGAHDDEKRKEPGSLSEQEKNHCWSSSFHRLLSNMRYWITLQLPRFSLIFSLVVNLIKRRRTIRKTVSIETVISYIINCLLTWLARAVLRNIGPRSFLYGPHCARNKILIFFEVRGKLQNR